MTDDLNTLVEALHRLAREIRAALALAKPSMTEVLGSANVQLLDHRLRELQEAAKALTVKH
jgi:hypothetical protein